MLSSYLNVDAGVLHILLETVTSRKCDLMCLRRSILPGAYVIGAVLRAVLWAVCRCAHVQWTGVLCLFRHWERVVRCHANNWLGRCTWHMEWVMTTGPCLSRNGKPVICSMWCRNISKRGKLQCSVLLLRHVISRPICWLCTTTTTLRPSQPQKHICDLKLHIYMFVHAKLTD